MMRYLVVLTRSLAIVLSVATILIGASGVVLSLAGHSEMLEGVVNLLPMVVGFIAGLYLLSVLTTMLRIEKRLDELRNTFGGPVSGFDRGT